MGSLSTVPTPFPERLKELVAEQGTSIARLYDDATWTGDGPKPSKAQLDKSMRGLLPVRPETVEMLAAALGVAPETFAEYELAMMREQLDERQVGLDEAYRTLEAIRAATRKAARSGARRASARPASSPKPTPTDRRGQQTAGAE